MLTDYLHFKSISLRTRAKALYWVCTALIMVPGSFLILAALISYHVPPAKILRDRFSVWLLHKAKELGWWRDWQVRDYITFEQQGFRLTIE